MREVTDPKILSMLDEQDASPVVPQVDENNMSWGDAVAQGVSNLPESSVQFAKNIAYPFVHPVQTVEGIGALLSGDDQAVGGLKDFIVNRYGGEEQLKTTLSKDPVGLLSDVALLFTGLGAGAKATGATGQIARGLSTAGKVLDPVNAATTVVGKGVGAVGKIAPKISPEGLYASTLKKGALVDKLTPDQQAKVAATGLKYDVPINRSGLEKVSGLLDDISIKIDDAVTSAAQAGDTIPRKRILQALDEMKSPRGLYYDTADRAAHFKTIDRVMDNIRNNYPDQIPVDQVQRLKQNTQAFLKKNYGKLSSTRIEAQKSLAYSAREALAEKYPELAQLNAKSKELIELEKVLEPAVQRIASRDVMGIGLPVKVGAGAAADSVLGTGGAGATAGLVAGVLDTPAVKAWVARTLYKLREGKITGRDTKKYAVRESARQTGQTSQQVQGQPEPVPYSR